ncbi:hypothetical protein [Rhodococcus sp. 11-3]|uniref:hypothetical protein n=1 Tax=Rhodococcus sp. 11-3 TaxID=2854796 RepID=UPI002040388F|nr:hypothetical protein [Rhodococcus sp. 11-3]USC15521.1 hypothetical protein KZJ41_00695 [Rhodococcus sp. 11-3]
MSFEDEYRKYEALHRASRQRSEAEARKAAEQQAQHQRMGPAAINWIAQSLKTAADKLAAAGVPPHTVVIFDQKIKYAVTGITKFIFRYQTVDDNRPPNAYRHSRIIGYAWPLDRERHLWLSNNGVLFTGDSGLPDYYSTGQLDMSKMNNRVREQQKRALRQLGVSDAVFLDKGRINAVREQCGFGDLIPVGSDDQQVSVIAKGPWIWQISEFLANLGRMQGGYRKWAFGVLPDGHPVFIIDSEGFSVIAAPIDAWLARGVSRLIDGWPLHDLKG